MRRTGRRCEPRTGRDAERLRRKPRLDPAARTVLFLTIRRASPKLRARRTPTMSDYARRVTEAAKDFKDGNAKLSAITNTWADPPDPDKPAIIDALEDVKRQAAIATRLADGMIARLR
jgi:hypothetical protein